jgi:hypothetical protein
MRGSLRAPSAKHRNAIYSESKEIERWRITMKERAQSRTNQILSPNSETQTIRTWGRGRSSPIGNVPEVNGGWALEIHEFVPTSGELLALAQHWAGIAIERTYVEWANATVSVSTNDWRRIYFAWRRVYRIRALLVDVIDRVVDDQIKKFHEKDEARWDPATWENFLRLIDREAQERRLAPVSDFFDPSSDAGPET